MLFPPPASLSRFSSLRRRANVMSEWGVIPSIAFLLLFVTTARELSEDYVLCGLRM
jgi:hypothetical protein